MTPRWWSVGGDFKPHRVFFLFLNYFCHLISWIKSIFYLKRGKTQSFSFHFPWNYHLDFWQQQSLICICDEPTNYQTETTNNWSKKLQFLFLGEFLGPLTPLPDINPAECSRCDTHMWSSDHNPCVQILKDLNQILVQLTSQIQNMGVTLFRNTIWFDLFQFELTCHYWILWVVTSPDARPVNWPVT